jgi:hypothetical protein
MGSPHGRNVNGRYGMGLNGKKPEGLGSGSGTLKVQLYHPCCKTPGIAHTLGKLVIPVTQSLDDVPFDMAHHRVLKYLSNQEGLSSLESMLAEELRQVSI